MRPAPKTDWRTAHVALAVLVAVSPLAVGGGGGVDNDSPFGAPSSPTSGVPSGTNPMTEAPGVCDSVVAVDVKTGGSFDPDVLAVLGPRVELVGPVSLAASCSGANHGERSVVAAEVVVPEGAAAQGADTAEGVALQGTFELRSDLPVILRGSPTSPVHFGLLVLGTALPDGAVAAEHAVQIPVVDGAIDVSAIQAALAAHEHALGGKVARIVIVGLEPDVSGGGMTLVPEASVVFAVRSDAELTVDTTLKSSGKP